MSLLLKSFFLKLRITKYVIAWNLVDFSFLRTLLLLLIISMNILSMTNYNNYANNIICFLNLKTQNQKLKTETDTKQARFCGREE